MQDLGDAASPNHDWTTTIPASTIGNAFGVGTLQSISTTGNGLGADGGRVLSATIKGSTRDRHGHRQRSSAAPWG